MLIYKLKRNEISKRTSLKTKLILLKNQEKIIVSLLHDSFLFEHYSKENQLILEMICQNIFFHTINNDDQIDFIILKHENTSIIYNPITQKEFYFPHLYFFREQNKATNTICGVFLLHIGNKTTTMLITIDTTNLNVIELENEYTFRNLEYRDKDNIEENRKIFLNVLQKDFIEPLMSEKAKKRLKQIYT